MDNHISAAVGEAEDSLTSLTASETFSSLCESEEILMPAYHGSEHTDILLQSPIGQCSVKTTDIDSMKCSTTPASDEQDSSVLIALGADPKCQEGSVMSKSPSSSSEKLFMYLEQLGQSHVLTELSRTSESTDHEYKQQYSEHDTGKFLNETNFPSVTMNIIAVAMKEELNTQSMLESILYFPETVDRNLCNRR